MTNQDSWNPKDLEFLNFFWEEEIIPCVIRKPIVAEKPIIISEEKRVKKPEPKVFIQQEEPKPVIPELKTVKFYCYPAVQIHHSDDLYGDSYSQRVYGKLFSFEAVILEITDLSLEFWTFQKIDRGSLVCIDPKNRKEAKRWWRSESFFEKTDGFVVKTILSDESPDLTIS